MELFERDEALAQLAGWLRQAAGGEGCLALVGGEAGVGKSTLVQRFCQEAAARARILFGACDALSTPRPLGPLLDIATAIGGELDRLIQGAAQRDQVFGACLREFSGTWRPTVVVFEDMHWADEATLDLLRFLGRRIGSCRAVLIATYRDDEVGPRHPLRILLGDLATAPHIRRMTVIPLSFEAVQQIAKGSDLDPGALHRQTGGNPFFVTEVLAAGGGIPDTIRDAVLTRLSRLSPATRAALDVVAVAGSPVDIALLKRLLGDEIGAVDECLDAGILRAEQHAVAFRHELARDAMIHAISPPRRIALHARTLAALEADPDERRNLFHLAHHAEAAHDRRAVLAHAPRAAERAAGLRAHREAAAQYARALRFADGVPIAERVPLLTGYAWECFVTGDMAPAIAAYEELIELTRRTGDRHAEVEHLAQYALALVRIGRNSDAERASRAALHLVEDLPLGPAHAQAFASQASLRMLNRDCTDAIAWGERTIAAAEQVGDTQDTIAGIISAGSALIISGDEERGRAEMERGLQLAREANLDSSVAMLLTNLGSSYGEIYRFSLADRYLGEGIAYATERDLDAARLYMTAWLALTRCYQGRWGEATKLIASVLHHPNAIAVSRTMALLAVGRIRARRGDPEVWEALDEALALAEPTATLQRIAPVRAARAEAAWIAGRQKQAGAEAGAAFDLVCRHEHRWHIGELGFWLWRAGEIDTPPSNAAEPFARQIAGDWAGAAAAWTALGCPYEEARTLADGGDEDPLRRALATFERLGARPMAAVVGKRLRDMGARQIPRGPRPTTRSNPANLTAREIEILGLIGDGLRNAAIANRLYLSQKTVEHHVSAILSKLGVQSRNDAARMARELLAVVQSDTRTAS